MAIVSGRAYVPTPPSRAPWAIAAAVCLLALAIFVLAVAPAVQPKPYEPPPWHRYDDRIGACEGSLILLERRVSMLEFAARRPNGSPTGSPTGTRIPTGSPIGDSDK